MSCPELETLYLATLEAPRLGAGRDSEANAKLRAHLDGCEACAERLELHRRLEKDLFRLVDPLPPPNLLGQVMARVEAAPPPWRTEARTGFAILAVALALSVAGLFAGHHSPASFGVGAAHALLTWRTAGIATLHALEVLRATAILPLVVIGGGLLLASLAGLRRLSGSSLTEAEASS